MEAQAVRKSSKSQASHDGKTPFLNDTLDALAELDSLWCNDCHQKFGRMAFEGKIVDGCRSCWQARRFMGHPPQNFAPYVKAQMLAREAAKAALNGESGVRPSKMESMGSGSFRRRQSLPGRLAEPSPEARGPIHRLNELHALAVQHNSRKAERLPSATRQALELPKQDSSITRRSVSKQEVSGSEPAPQTMQRRRSLPSIAGQEDHGHGDTGANGSASRSRRPLSGVYRTSAARGGAGRAASPAAVRTLPSKLGSSAHMRNAVDSLVYFLKQANMMDEKALRGATSVDGEGLVDRMQLARDLRRCGCMLSASELDGILRSLSVDGGTDVFFPEFFSIVKAHAKGLFGDEPEAKPKEVKLAFEPGSRVRSLVVLSWNDSQYENEEGTVEGPGPTSGTIAVRFDRTNERMFMKPSQLAAVSKGMVRRNSFVSNRRRTL